MKAPGMTGSPPSPPKTSSMVSAATLLPGRKWTEGVLMVVFSVFFLWGIGTFPTASAAERDTAVRSPNFGKPDARERSLLQDDGIEHLVVGRDPINDVLSQLSDGATVALETESTFHALAETINITKPVVIQGTGKDGPRLSCPEQGGPVFRIMASNVTLTDLAIEGCFQGPAVSGEGAGHINVLTSGFYNNAKAIDSGSHSLSIKDCLFDGNGDGGTTVSTAGNTTIKDSNFTNNVAAVSVSAKEGQDAFLDIQHSRFIKNTLINLASVSYLSRTELAQFWGFSDDTGGAALNVEGVTTVKVNDSLFENNHVPYGAIGGAVKMIDVANVRIEKTTFLNCSTAINGATVGAGGAIHVRNKGMEMETKVDISECLFSGNRARIGGGLSVFGVGDVAVEGSQFVGNHAEWGGGGMFLWDTRGVFKDDVLFDGNHAKLGGGVVLAEMSMVTIVRATFVRNSAEDGGAIHILAAGKTSIGEGLFQGQRFKGSADFQDNTASSKGGAIYVAEPNAPVAIGNSTFTHNIATLGGAIMIDDASSASIQNFKFLENEAVVGGGLLHLSKDLLQNDLEISGCTFEGNMARMDGKNVTAINIVGSELRGAGGGVAIADVDMDTTPQLRITMDSVTFTRNTAVVGGGLFVNSKGGPLGTACDPRTCTPQIGLYKPHFTKNTALEAGGAILATEPTHILLACNTVVDFVTERDVVRINSTEQMCDSWLGNEVSRTGYGDVIASTVVGDLMVSPAVVPNQRSGVALDELQIALVDALGQKMTSHVITGHLRVEARTGSNDLLLGGQTLSEIVNGTAEFQQLMAIGAADNHTIEFSVDQEYPKTALVKVEIRKCGFGEIVDASASGEECFPCPPGLYSFNPHNSSCDVCPRDGVCGGNGTEHLLVPKQGYWHSHPFSSRVIACLDEDACSYETRTEILQAFMPMGPLNLTVNEAMYPQCKKGHHGVLCGACDDDYGHVSVGKCRRCAGKGIALFIVALVTLWSSILVGLSVRGNLSTSRELVKADSEKAEAGRNLPVQQNGNGNRNRNPAQFGSAKLKATEMLKILINFLQVTGVIVQINSHWSETIKGLLSVQDSAGSFSLDTASSDSECAMPLNGSLPRSLATVLLSIGMPFGLAIIACLFWLIQAAKTKRGWSYLLPRIVITAWSILFFSYTSLTRQFMRITFCHSADGNALDLPYHDFSMASGSFWAADTDVKCFEGTHLSVLLAVAVPGLTLITAGVPLALIWFIFDNRKKLDDHGFKGFYGFIYQAYRPGSGYWDGMVMIRKASVNAVVVFAQVLGPNLQDLIMITVLMVALGIHVWRQPFRDDLNDLNNLESISLISTGLILFAGLYFNDPNMTSICHILLSMFVFLLSILLLLFFVRKILQALEHFLDEELISASQTPKQGLFAKAIQFVRLKVGVFLTKLKDVRSEKK